VSIFDWQRKYGGNWITRLLNKWDWFHYEVWMVVELYRDRREYEDRKGHLYCLWWGMRMRHWGQMRIREMRREERRERAVAGAKP